MLLLTFLVNYLESLITQVFDLFTSCNLMID